MNKCKDDNYINKKDDNYINKKLNKTDMILCGYVDRCPSLLFDVYDLFIIFRPPFTAKATYRKTAEAKLYT